MAEKQPQFYSFPRGMIRIPVELREIITWYDLEA